jgi:PncC family amidohydrolase
MEDFSGGWLAAAIMESPNSSAFFKGGLVAPTDEAKAAFGVDIGLLAKYGSVSPEIAQAMANAARKLLKTDLAIGITAARETTERPMGITYVGIAGSDNRLAIIKPRRKQSIVSSALFELRNWLLSPESGDNK